LYTNAFQHTGDEGNLFSEVKVIGPLLAGLPLKYLGITLNQTLSWSDHIEALFTKVNQRHGIIRRVKHLLTVDFRRTLVNSLVMPIFDYADFVWGDKNNSVLMNHAPSSSSQQSR
jgi:hypothetical protein